MKKIVLIFVASLTATLLTNCTDSSLSEVETYKKQQEIQVIDPGSDVVQPDSPKESDVEQ